MNKLFTKSILLASMGLFLFTSSIAHNKGGVIDAVSSQQNAPNSIAKSTAVGGNGQAELTSSNANFLDPAFISFAQNSRRNVAYGQLSIQEKVVLWNDYQVFLNAKGKKQTSQSGQKGILLFEDFEAGIPASWTTIDSDGFAPNAGNPFQYITSWDTLDNFDEAGDAVAASTSWTTPASPVDDWLITPQVMLDGGSTLIWDAKAQDPAFADGYEVRISTTGTAPADFLANPALFTIPAEVSTWTTRTVDLATAGYTNQMVYIAFRNTSTDQYILMVDDVEIQDALGNAGVSDASIANASPIGSGIAGGYTNVPLSQADNNDVAFAVEVSSLGTDSITGVSLSGTVNPGAASVSGSSSLIAAGSSDFVVTNTYAAMPSTSYTADFDVSINETDGDTTNNSVSYTYTTAAVGDSLYARETATTSSVNLGFTGGTGRFGNVYTVTAQDTMTSLTIFFGANATAQQIELFVGDINGTGDIYNSGPINRPTAAGFVTYSTSGFILPPGDYIIGVNQFDIINAGVGLTTTNFTPNTAYFGGYGAWSTLESIGNPAFNGAFMVRPGFSNSFVPNTLTPFTLQNPSSGTNLTLQGAPSTPVVIDWLASSSSASLPVTYEWQADLQGGTFSPALVGIASDNGGSSNTLTLDFGSIDALLASLGIPAGGTANLSWRVVATSGVAQEISNVFDINITRGVLNTASRDFEAYNAGDAISSVDTEWALWPAAGVTDAFVSTAQAQSGTNSLAFDGVTFPIEDPIFLLGDQTSGTWGVGFSMYIPNGSSGYYNIQETQSTGVNWVIGNVNFNANGTGVIDGYTPVANFTYPQGQWFDVRHYVDLDNDSIQIFIDGTFVKASAYTEAAGGATQLGALNFYSPGAPGAVKTYYLDDMYFQTDSLRTLPAPPADAVISSAQIFATGRAGYALIPASQDDPSVFKATIQNNGNQPITNVNVTATLNPGANNVSGNVASIAGFGSSVVEAGSFTANQATAYSGSFNVSITETDATPANNTASFNFTSGSLSDSIFALESENAPSLQLGFNGTGRFANRFEFTSADTITSVTVAFTTPSGTNYEIVVDAYDPATNTVSSNLWTSGAIPVPAAGFHNYPVNLPVTAGSYLVSVLQTESGAFMGMARSDLFVRGGSSFTGNLAGTSLSDLAGSTFPSTFIIRANMNTAANQPATLNAFDLVSPSTGARVETDLANASTPVNIDWNASSISSGTPAAINYDWLLDAQGGNFSSPLATIPSNNNGLDTALTLTLGAIDTLLNTLGIPQGDSVDVIWTVRASVGVSNLEANNGPFDIKLVRGAATGLSQSVFESSVSMYPNPTEGVLTISDSRNIVESISILNLIGSEVKQFDNVAKTNQYDLNDLSSGVYLVKFITKEGNYTQKLIIE